MISEEFCPLNAPLWNVSGLAVYSPGLSPAGFRPAAMRPTLPVGFNPVVRIHPPRLSPRAVVAVHLLSPPCPSQVLDNSDILFKNAAWKNGIKITTLKEEQDGNSNDDAENFEKLAKRNGIKIGKSKKIDEVTDTENLDPVDDDNDAMVTNFEEIARRRGIRVGEPTEASSEPADCTMEPEHLSENPEEVCVTDLFEIQAKKCGIRLGKEGETPPSCVETSSVGHEDEVCSEEDGQEVANEAEMVPEEMVPVIADSYFSDFEDERYTSLDTEEGELSDFEELARKHGIKIGKGSQEFIPHCAQPSTGNVQLITFEERASKHGIQVIRPIVADVGTQTFSESLFYVEHSTQTSHTDLGIEYSNSAVQVDIVPEAFKEEFTRWKLEESSNSDAEEMSYKSLYLEEYSERKELEKRLESEMDLSVRTQRSHKQAMEEMKKEVNDMEDKVEKLKKEVKTVKKHKETEIKRLTKEKKQQEEEVEALTNKLSLKEVALKALKTILENQMIHVEELEAKVKELCESSPVQHCEKCCHQQSAVQRSSSPGSLSEGHADYHSDISPTVSDKWRVYTPGYRKPPLTSAASLQHNLTNTSKMDELSEINLSNVKSNYAGIVKLKALSKAVDDNDCGLSGSGKLLHQECSRKSSSSPPCDHHSPIWLKGTEMIGKMDRLSDVNLSEKEQGRSVDRLVGDGNGSVSDTHTQKCLSQVDSESKRKTSSDKDSCSTGLPPGLEALMQNSKQTVLSTGVQLPSQSPSADQQFGDVFCETSSTGTSEKSNFTDTNQESEKPPSAASVLLQPSPYLPGVNSQNLYRYLSALINNPTNQEGDKRGAANIPPPPPGLNTIPVPTEMPVSSVQGGACKFGTFDKLMNALKKRFPEHSRSDLIMYLKKAKADCGPAGFKGKQISEVVEHVANVMRLS